MVPFVLFVAQQRHIPSSPHVKEHTLQSICKINKQRASWGHHNAGHDHISTAKEQRVSVFVPAASHARLLPRFTSVPLLSSLFSADIWESHWLACEQKLRLHNASQYHRLHTMSSCLTLSLSSSHATIRPSSQALLRLRLQHVITKVFHRNKKIFCK